MKRSWYDSVSDETRRRAEKIYIDGKFSDYESLTAQINELLQADGYEITLARTTVHRQGLMFQRQIENQRELLMLAKLTRDEFGTDEGEVNDLISRLYQQKIFDLLSRIDVSTDEKVSLRDFSLFGKAVAALGSTVTMQQRLRRESEIRAEAAEQAVYELLKRCAAEFEEKAAKMMNELVETVLEHATLEGKNKVRVLLAKYTERIISLVKDETGVYKPAGLSERTVSEIRHKLLGIPGESSG